MTQQICWKIVYRWCIFAANLSVFGDGCKAKTRNDSGIEFIYCATSPIHLFCTAPTPSRGRFSAVAEQLFYTYGEIYDGSHAVSHYVPLHSALAGRRYTRAVGLMSVTDALSDQLICLPMWIGLTVEMQERVVAELLAVLLHVESV